MDGSEHTITRRTMVAGAGGLAAILLAACGGSQSSGSTGKAQSSSEIDGDLYYFNWSDYISPKVVSGFEREYGVTVHQSYFASGPEGIAKLAAHEPFDVAEIGSYLMPSAVSTGLIRKLDLSAIPSFRYVLDFFRDPPYDRNSAHSVPYGFGPIGVAYLKDRLRGKMTHSFNDLWNHPEAAGHTYLFDDLAQDLALSLARLGDSINSDVGSQVTKAADQILKLKPRLGGFEANISPLIESGQAWLAQAYSADVLPALRAAKDPSNIGFELCRESGIFTGGGFTIPVAAKHPGTAMKFLDWILRPEHVSENVSYIGYPIPTAVGMSAFKKSMAEYPMLTFSTAYMSSANGWLIEPTGSRLQMWNQQWTRVVA